MIVPYRGRIQRTHNLDLDGSIRETYHESWQLKLLGMSSVVIEYAGQFRDMYYCHTRAGHTDDQWEPNFFATHLHLLEDPDSDYVIFGEAYIDMGSSYRYYYPYGDRWFNATEDEKSDFRDLVARICRYRFKISEDFEDLHLVVVCDRRDWLNLHLLTAGMFGPVEDPNLSRWA